jgi:hypothetical protein
MSDKDDLYRIRFRTAQMTLAALSLSLTDLTKE